ncbi:MAG: MMPL family transporter [Thiotrichales bacterium]|jgi:hypothetical protein|nr:MMPL family transporter [Thiotrichales bacterium]MBT3613097.1 MMPL family transporter [Thiotrichales bacterium]MBT3752140.1 MMPL family transporter [Thiotrichales bacterium]MBT3837812.1 MMPL family transporter [Thiotrichales bacterium]MBT4152773.1 MMPL family transporter [Thiotrichales bacterium]
MDRSGVERAFISYTGGLIRWKWFALVVVFVLTALLLTNLPKITIDTSNEGFLRADDPILLDYNRFREQFGREEVVLIAMRPQNIFAPEFVETLKKFHSELEEQVPHLDEVTSLVNVRYTVGNESELLVEDLMEAFPNTPEGYAELRRVTLSHPFYKNLLISEDGKVTTLVIETKAFSTPEVEDPLSTGFDDMVEGGFDDDIEQSSSESEELTFLTDAENGEVVDAVMELVEEYRSEEFPLEVAGSPLVMEILKKSMQNDMRKFTLSMVGIIVIFLFITFRRGSGVFIPLVVVILSLLSTIALMAATGVPLKLTTQILPSFIMAVGIGDSVHILSIFYRRFDQNGDKMEAIQYAVGHSGLAVVMTSLTTAAGLFSFSTAELGAVAELGMFGGAGAIFAMLFSVILLPILLAILPLKQRSLGEKASSVEQESKGVIDKLLNGAAHLSSNHPIPIVFGALLLFLVALFGISQIQFKHDVMTWFPEDEPIRVATENVDRDMRGTISVEVLIDSGKADGLYNPTVIGNLAKLQDSLDSLGSGDAKLVSGKRSSVVDILRETNQALNENRVEEYRVPTERKLLAQEMLLFENTGSDDLEKMVDSELRTARLTLRLPWRDAGAYTELVGELQQRSEAAFVNSVDSSVDSSDADSSVTISITGLMMIFARTLDAMMSSMLESYTIAAVVISIMMILLVGSVRLGLISMIPNLLPITIVLGVMGIFGLPLDAFTMLIGSIALGLAVDDTVHFMHNFMRYYKDSGSSSEAIVHTMHTAGRAMVVTTIVLSLGFFIFMSSEMNNLLNFGGLTGLAIILSLFADILLAPALMTLIFRKKLNLKV